MIGWAPSSLCELLCKFWTSITLWWNSEGQEQLSGDKSHFSLQLAVSTLSPSTAVPSKDSMHLPLFQLPYTKSNSHMVSKMPTVWPCEYNMAIAKVQFAQGKHEFWIKSQEPREWNMLEHGTACAYKLPCTEPFYKLNQWALGTVGCTYCSLATTYLHSSESSTYPQSHCIYILFPLTPTPFLSFVPGNSQFNL